MYPNEAVSFLQIYLSLKSLFDCGFWQEQVQPIVFELLEALLLNKDRYGYMACPCRLAAGDREQDRDIICPCDYREPDVAEFGSCYCNLYVTAEWNDGRTPHEYVPERRPVDKMAF